MEKKDYTYMDEVGFNSCLKSGRFRKFTFESCDINCISEDAKLIFMIDDFLYNYIKRKQIEVSGYSEIITSLNFPYFIEDIGTFMNMFFNYIRTTYPSLKRFRDAVIFKKITQTEHTIDQDYMECVILQIFNKYFYDEIEVFIYDDKEFILKIDLINSGRHGRTFYSMEIIYDFERKNVRRIITSKSKNCFLNICDLSLLKSEISKDDIPYLKTKQISELEYCKDKTFIYPPAIGVENKDSNLISIDPIENEDDLRLIFKLNEDKLSDNIYVAKVVVDMDLINEHPDMLFIFIRNKELRLYAEEINFDKLYLDIIKYFIEKRLGANNHIVKTFNRISYATALDIANFKSFSSKYVVGININTCEIKDDIDTTNNLLKDIIKNNKIDKNMQEDSNMDNSNIDTTNNIFKSIMGDNSIDDLLAQMINKDNKNMKEDNDMKKNNDIDITSNIHEVEQKLLQISELYMEKLKSTLGNGIYTTLHISQEQDLDNDDLDALKTVISVEINKELY